jgi:hypothetical protein
MATKRRFGFIIFGIVGHVANAHTHTQKNMVTKPEGRRELARPGCRWEVSIRMDAREAGWEDVDWMRLAQDRVQWRVLVNTINCRFL